MINNLIESMVYNVVSSSMVTNNVTGWNIYKVIEYVEVDGEKIPQVDYPLIGVIVSKTETIHKEFIRGIYNIDMSIICQCDKTVTTDAEIYNVADKVFKTFQSSGVNTSGSVYIHTLTYGALEDENVNDGKTITLPLQFICQTI